MLQGQTSPVLLNQSTIYMKADAFAKDFWKVCFFFMGKKVGGFQIKLVITEPLYCCQRHDRGV